MSRFVFSALFGFLVLTMSLGATTPAPAAADTQQIASTQGGSVASPFELAGMKPAIDMAQFDSESVLRAVFMTAILGFVIFGRSAKKRADAEAVVDRRARIPTHLLMPLSVPAMSDGVGALPVPVLHGLSADHAVDPNGAVVWVNTKTGVYHEPGSRWFGKTREGEFVLKRSTDTGRYLTVRNVRKYDGPPPALAAAS